MPPAPPVPQRVAPAQLEAFIARAFQAVGVCAAEAVTIAQLMARADVNGSEGRGVFRLPQYIRRIKVAPRYRWSRG